MHSRHDFSFLTNTPGALCESERQLIEICDLIFAQCPELAEHCGQWTQKTVHVFPPGVDLRAFPFTAGPRFKLPGPTDPQVSDGLQKLSHLREKGGPVVGYIGGIHRFFDTNLVAEMARQRPDWTWVLVGPAQTTVDPLASLDNVVLPGLTAHEDLRLYLDEFDSFYNSLQNDTGNIGGCSGKINGVPGGGKTGSLHRTSHDRRF